MTKTFKDVKGIEEACWVGYKQVGMKKKGNRQVPNCVKEEIVYAVFGKDYVYEEPVTEAGVEDMYKGKLNKDQLNTIKNTWKNKKLSDVTQGVKDMIRGYDAFTRMDIKQANIKYLSDLINDEVQHEEIEMIDTLTNMVEDNELRASVRKSEELKEFSTDQISRLAKSYAGLAGKTMSVDNANKLRKIFDKIPDSSLNDLRKKKIPFISGLALSRMIQKKIPVTESTYEDKEEKQIVEADLSKSQIKKVHKQADDLPKKDFMKRYGKDGDSVRYATATNMVKKKLGLGESNFIKKGELKMNDTYKQRLTSAMEHFSISSLGELNEDDHKIFFTYVEDMKEGLSAAQKKLPAGLQKAILAKQGKKDEMHDMKKKEMKEEDAYDGTPAEVAKMKAKEKADAEKAKSKKDEMMAGKKPMNAMKSEMASGNMMAMKAMKMPIKAMMNKKTEDLVGGQKKLDKDKDGDLDAKDFAALRKTKSEAVKTGEADAEPKTKELNAMIKDPHKSKEDKPMKDMNAMYMKSNVKAAVKDNGGSDMAKVKDAPDMKDAMKKINATYGMKKENNGRYLQTKPGSLEEAVLKSRGLVK